LVASDILSVPVVRLKDSFRLARPYTLSSAPRPSPINKRCFKRAGQSEKHAGTHLSATKSRTVGSRFLFLVALPTPPQPLDLPVVSTANLS
jgi:hypothetical protein